MCTLPGDLITSPCRIGERREIMLNENCPLSPTSGPNSASNTLLRQLLAGVDPASVRSYSELMNSKFALRRTSSMSVTSRHRFRRSNLDGLGGVEMRPRRATMYSQPSLSRRSFPSPKNDATGAKRSKHSIDSAPTVEEEEEEVAPLTIKVEATDPTKDSPSEEFDNPKPPWKPKEASQKEATTDSTTSSSMTSVTVSVSDIASNPQPRTPMRPRAHTASELENVLKVCTEKLYPREDLTRFLEFCFRGGQLVNGVIHRTSRSLDPITTEPSKTGDSSSKMDKSDTTSPLSQLLESTPPYNPARLDATASGVKPPWPRSVSSLSSNALSALSLNTDRFSHSRNNFLHGTSSLRFFPKADTLHQILDLSTNTSPPEVRPQATNPLSVVDQVLDYSRKEQNLLTITPDELFHWSGVGQAAMLQQLFQRVGLPAAEPATGAIGLTPHSPSLNLALGSLPPSWPIRLATKTSHLLCRRVGEWLLAADAYTTRCCINIPPNALLATAAAYRYCRCTEIDQTPPGKILSTHAMPKLGPTLKAILQRIWPQLLLSSMIRENFSFTVTPLTSAEVETIVNFGGGAPNAATDGSPTNEPQDLLIARLGTAHALLNLIETGNQLLLDTQVLECVRKCIFAQYAYPHHYTISYCSAIEELRRCCIRCSGDSTLFANVLLLMNEMQSISPEAIHCLFSVDKLSALFS